MLVEASMLNAGWWPPDVSPARSRQMRGEVLVHLEHGHLVLAKDLPELVVGQYLGRFSGFCRLCERMYSQILVTTWPRRSGPEPITAASSSDSCSGFCRAFTLTSLAFFSYVLVAIDLLQGCLWRASLRHACPPGYALATATRNAVKPGASSKPRFCRTFAEDCAR